MNDYRKKNKKSGYIGLAMGFIVCLAFFLIISTPVSAKTYEIKKGEIKGSSLMSNFHFFDGNKETTLSTFNGRDSIGEVTGQLVSDYAISGRCYGDKNYAFHVNRAQGVLSYESGQLFLTARNKGKGCLLALPKFTQYPLLWQPTKMTLTITYDIVGGSGDFTGASGAITSTLSGVLLWNDLTISDVNQFGSFTATYEGSFDVPE